MSKHLLNDEDFEKEYGFSLPGYLESRRSCADSLRDIASHIETVSSHAGVVKTSFGAAGVLLGLGALFAPFTGGTSLALPVVGGRDWVIFKENFAICWGSIAN